MGLLDRCKTVRADIGKRDSLLREVKEAEKYSERVQDILESREALAGAIGRLRVLRQHHIDVGRLRDPRPVLERLKLYEQKVGDSPSESGTDHGHLKRSLEALRKAYAESAQAALEAVIGALPTIEETFLRQVEVNPVYKKKVADIRAAREELRQEGRRELTTAGLDEFLKKRERLRILAEDLKPSDFPKEVLEFFKAAREGAPLDKLTEGVQRWFAERNQLNNLRVIVVDQ
jgi:hypothetical protein